MTINAAIRTLGVTMLLLSGLACVVTPEPIPLNEAGGGYDVSILQGDASADLMAGFDAMPPSGDIVVHLPDTGAPPDAASDLTLDGAPTETGPPEGGPGEGGPQEAGPAPDLGHGG
jgi:hypothetical protein